jgi:predicted transposase YbfD/YdcC
MIKLNFKILLVIIVFAFSFCKNGEKADENIVVDDTTKQAVQETKLNAQNVFNSMPDRKIILKLIEDNKIEYNPDFLNDPNSVSKYTIEFYKAANLGIYGSDLSIANSFEQTQESMVFLKCVNSLAANIGVNNAFDQVMFDRMEANRENKDSTLEIITAAFKKADEILKVNNRPATSAVILAGSWVEGLYVSCQMAKTVNGEKIIKTIIDQNESLKNLIIMLEASNLAENTKYIVTDLKAIREAFNVAEANTVHNLETIKTINEKVTALRNKLISAGA